MKLNIDERTMILEALQVQVDAIQDEITDLGANVPEDAESLATCKANMADYQALMAKVNNFNWSPI